MVSCLELKGYEKRSGVARCVFSFAVWPEIGDGKYARLHLRLIFYGFDGSIFYELVPYNADDPCVKRVGGEKNRGFFRP